MCSAIPLSLPLQFYKEENSISQQLHTWRPFSSLRIWISLLRTWVLLRLSLIVDCLSELWSIACSMEGGDDRWGVVTLIKNITITDVQQHTSLDRQTHTQNSLPRALSVSLGMLFPAISRCVRVLFCCRASRKDRPPSRPMLFHLTSIQPQHRHQTRERTMTPMLSRHQMVHCSRTQSPRKKSSSSLYPSHQNVIFLVLKVLNGCKQYGDDLAFSWALGTILLTPLWFFQLWRQWHQRCRC